MLTNLTMDLTDCQSYDATDLAWWAEQNAEHHVDGVSPAEVLQDTTDHAEELEAMEAAALEAELLDRLEAMGYLASPTRLTDEDILVATGCVG